MAIGTQVAYPKRKKSLKNKIVGLSLKNEKMHYKFLFPSKSWSITTNQVMSFGRSTCLHPSFPLLSLMPIKVKYGFSRECWHITMFLQRSHCWNYDQKNEEKEEKIAIVILPKERNAKNWSTVSNKLHPIVCIKMCI